MRRLPPMLRRGRRIVRIRYTKSNLFIALHDWFGKLLFVKSVGMDPEFKNHLKKMRAATTTAVADFIKQLREER